MNSLTLETPLLDKELKIHDLLNGMHSWADMARPINPRLLDCFKAVWKAQNNFVAYPDVISIMADYLCKEWDVSDEGCSALKEVSLGLVTRNRRTQLRKYYINYNLYLLSVYQKFSRTGEVPAVHVVRIWGDFSNMGGLSTALCKKGECTIGNGKTIEGVERADLYVVLMGRYIKQELRKFFPNEYILLYREGADEIGGFIVFKNEPDISSLTQFSNSVNRFSASFSVKLGISHLEHRKYKGEYDQSGCRFICGFVVVDDFISVEEEFRVMEEKVKSSRFDWGGCNRPNKIINSLTSRAIKKYENTIKKEIKCFPPILPDNEYQPQYDYSEHASEEIYTVPWLRLERTRYLSNKLTLPYKAEELFISMARMLSYDPEISAWRAEDFYQSLLNVSRIDGSHFLILCQQINFAGLNETFGHKACDNVFLDMNKSLIRTISTINNVNLLSGKFIAFRPSDNIMTTGNKIAVIAIKSTPNSVYQLLRFLVEISVRHNYELGLSTVPHPYRNYSGAPLAFGYDRIERLDSVDDSQRFLARLFETTENHEEDGLLLDSTKFRKWGMIEAKDFRIP